MRADSIFFLSYTFFPALPEEQTHFNMLPNMQISFYPLFNQLQSFLACAQGCSSDFTGALFGMGVSVVAIPSMILLVIHYDKKFKNPYYPGSGLFFFMMTCIVLSYIIWILALVESIDAGMHSVKAFFTGGALFDLFILLHIVLFIFYYRKKRKPRIGDNGANSGDSEP